MIETFEGEKMLIKAEGGQSNLENGYFAHESKLYLSYDDFGF